MTQHYKDTNNNIYGFKPSNIEVTPITMEEIPAILEAKKTPEQRKEMRVAEIDSRLKEIDVESVRPLRAIQAGAETPFDIDKLAQLDSEAESLRAERGTLV